MIVAIIAETETDKKKSLNLPRPWMNIFNGNLFHQVCEEGPHPNLVKRESVKEEHLPQQLQFQRNFKYKTRLWPNLTPPYINLKHVIICVRTVNLFKMNLCHQRRPSLSATLEGVDWVDFLVITFENDSTIFTIVNNLIGMKMKLNFFHPRKIKNKNHLQALSSYHAHQEYGSHLSESWHILY